MPGGARRFELQIKAEFEEAIEELKEQAAPVLLEGFKRIVQRTPVDEGRARNNWFGTVGTETFETRPDLSLGGTDSINDAVRAVTQWTEADGWPSLTYQNNLPYIERLEDGYSSQAPSGMVGVTFVELQAAFS